MRNIEKKKLPSCLLSPPPPSLPLPPLSFFPSLPFRGSMNYALLSKSQPSLHRKNHSGFQVYPRGFKLSVRYNFPEILLGSIRGDVFHVVGKTLQDVSLIASQPAGYIFAKLVKINLPRRDFNRTLIPRNLSVLSLSLSLSRLRFHRASAIATAICSRRERDVGGSLRCKREQ